MSAMDTFNPTSFLFFFFLLLSFKLSNSTTAEQSRFVNYENFTQNKIRKRGNDTFPFMGPIPKLEIWFPFFAARAVCV